MSFSSVTSASQISSHPLIVEPLESFSAVKIGNLSLGRKKLLELAGKWKQIEGLNEVSCGRIQFVASEILRSLNEGKTESENVFSALCECTNLKNALQVEAVLFGNIAPIIDKFIEMSKTPYLAELIQKLPEIVSKIKYSPMAFSGDVEGYYIIDATVLLTHIESIGVENMPDDFDVMFFSLLQRYEWRGGNIIIPINQLPSKAFLEQIIREKGLYAKLIAQVLYLCLIDEEVLFQTYTTRTVAFEVMKIFNKDIFDNYLLKRPLMPFFCLVVDGIKKAKAQGIDLENFYLQRCFIDPFSRIISKDWLKESSSVYQIVKKIEIFCRKILDRSMVAALDEMSPDKTCDSHVLIYCQMMQDMKRQYNFAQNYPISREKPFCRTAEEFENVVITNFIGKLTFNTKATEPSDFFTMPKESRPLKPIKKTKGGSALAILKPEKPSVVHEEEEDKKQLASEPLQKVLSLSECAIVEAATVKEPFLQKLKESIKSSFLFSQSIRVHPRVESWRISAESGLEYYKFSSEPSSHHLSQELMVRRHRFPEIFFSVIFNKNYSKEKQIRAKSLCYHNHFRSVVIINEKKHILEATVDTSNVLYHFYLRPISTLGDYFEITKDSFEEFPPLGSMKPSESKSVQPLDISGFVVDPDGHLHLSFEGGHYKILYLGQRKDADSVL
jgi:hypothetical protein